VVVAIFEKTSEVGNPLKSALDLLINDFPDVSFAMVAGNASPRLLVQQQISSFPTVRGYVDAECRYEWDGKDIANLQSELRLLLDSASVHVAPVLRARFGQEPYLVSTYYPDPPPGTIPRVLTTLSGFINLQQFNGAVDTSSATPVPNLRQWMELLLQVDVFESFGIYVMGMLQRSCCDVKVSEYFATAGLNKVLALVGSVLDSDVHNSPIELLSIRLAIPVAVPELILEYKHSGRKKMEPPLLSGGNRNTRPLGHPRRVPVGTFHDTGCDATVDIQYSPCRHQ
jgi:hypothetical protein